MKKIVAVAALVLTLAGIAPTAAQAGGATSAALGLASFAVFNQLVFGLFTPRVWATTTVYGGPYYGGYYYGGYYPQWGMLRHPPRTTRPRRITLSRRRKRPTRRRHLRCRTRSSTRMADTYCGVTA